MSDDAVIFPRSVSHQIKTQLPEPARLLYSQKESSRILGISLRTMQALIAVKKIPARRIGRRVLVHRKDLEAFARHDHLRVGGE